MLREGKEWGSRSAPDDKEEATMSREAVIVVACRTPVGKAVKGTTRDVRADEMAAGVIVELLRRTQGKLDPAEVDDVILGCAFPEGDQGLNMAPPGALRAGPPSPVPRGAGHRPS